MSQSAFARRNHRGIVLKRLAALLLGFAAVTAGPASHAQDGSNTTPATTDAAAQQPGPQGTSASTEPTATDREPAAQSAADSQLNDTTPTGATPETAATIPVESKPETGGAQTAKTQSGDVVTLDEIQVTASKRVKTARDLAGSVNALRGEDLEKIGAQSMEDYIKLVPGVSLPKANADSSSPVIRGITTSILPGFTQLTTGIFLDDLPLSDAIFPMSVPDVNPFDLERVEVLKGPQGTLFGAGALSGAVRFITQKPNFSVWQAKLLASGTSSNFSEGISPFVAGAINVPLFGDSAAIRAAGLYQKDNGRIDNLNTGQKDVDKLKRTGGRVLGAWNPVEKLSLSALYFQQETNQDDFNSTDTPRRFERSNTPFPSGRNSRFNAVNFTGNYAADGLDVLSSTNFGRKKNNIFTEGSRAAGEGTGSTRNPNGGEGGTDGTGAEDFPVSPIVAVSNDSKSKIFSQELRFASPQGGGGNFEWLAGASFLKSDLDIIQQAKAVKLVDDSLTAINAIPIFPLFTPVTNVGGSRDAQFLYVNAVSRATERAIFGEVTRRFGEHWEVTAGARAFRTRLVSDNLFTGPQVVILFGSLEKTDSQMIDERGVNPKFSVRYSFNRNLQTYILAAKGFQFGGTQINPVNPAFVSASDVSGGGGFGSYKSSKLWNYEWGIKQEWFERRLQFDTTLFYLSWKDLQLTEPVAVQGVGLFSKTSNVGHAHSDGLEVALRVLPFSGMTFSSSLAFLNAVTDAQFQAADGSFIPPGTRLPGTPKFQIANVFAYEKQFSLLGAWAAGLSLTHARAGKAFNDIKEFAQIGGYDTFDASIHLLRSDVQAQPDLRLAVNNFTDVRGLAGVASAATARQRDFFLINPRTVILSLAIRY